jgi:hypothetical protein
VTVQAAALGRVNRRDARVGGGSDGFTLRSRGGRAWITAVAAVVFFATAECCRQLYVDTYFDLYAGRYVAQHGIPERNGLTALAHGKPWVDQQWLAQLIFFRMWQLGGYAAVTLLSVALVAAGAAVLGALMLRRGASPLAMCAWTLAAIAVSYGYATARAQSFGYLFVPLVLWLVLGDDERRPPRPRTWVSIPLLVVWANVHGSVLLGAGFVGLHAACQAWGALRRHDPRSLAAYLLLGAAAAVALVCTPYGFGVARYYASLIGNPELSRNVAEWAPVAPSNPDFWAFYGVVIAIVIAVAIGWRRGARPQPEVVIFAVITFGVAVMAFRNTPWFGFAGCLLAADMLAGRALARATAAIFRRMLAAVLAACAVVVAIGMALEPARQYEASIPRQAIDVSARIADGHPRVPVLADQFSAVGLLWLHPALLGRVAFDVRVEQYNQAQLVAIFDFMAASGPGWQRLLHGYDLVVVSRQRHPGLADAIFRLPGWRVVYADDLGVVLERNH